LGTQKIEPKISYYSPVWAIEGLFLVVVKGDTTYWNIGLRTMERPSGWVTIGCEYILISDKNSQTRVVIILGSQLATHIAAERLEPVIRSFL